MWLAVRVALLLAAFIANAPALGVQNTNPALVYFHLSQAGGGEAVGAYIQTLGDGTNAAKHIRVLNRSDWKHALVQLEDLPKNKSPALYVELLPGAPSFKELQRELLALRKRYHDTLQVAMTCQNFDMSTADQDKSGCFSYCLSGGPYTWVDAAVLKCDKRWYDGAAVALSRGGGSNTQLAASSAPGGGGASAAAPMAEINIPWPPPPPKSGDVNIPQTFGKGYLTPRRGEPDLPVLGPSWPEAGVDPDRFLSALRNRTREMNQWRSELAREGAQVRKRFAPRASMSGYTNPPSIVHMLGCVTKLFDKAGVEMVLTDGALLGQMRSGTLLLKDSDLDITAEWAQLKKFGKGAPYKMLTTLSDSIKECSGCRMDRIKNLRAIVSTILKMPATTEPKIEFGDRELLHTANTFAIKCGKAATDIFPTFTFQQQNLEGESGKNPSSASLWSVRPRSLISINKDGSRRDRSYDFLCPASWMEPRPCNVSGVQTYCPAESVLWLETKYGPKWRTPLLWA